MKFTAIIILNVGLLLSGAQSAKAHRYQNETEEVKCETGLAKPLSSTFSSTLPSDGLMSDNNNGLLRSENNWGGGGDAPNPEKNRSTGMNTPIGGGLSVLMVFSFIFIFLKARIKNQQYDE